MKFLGRFFLVSVMALIFSGPASADENWDFKVSLLKHQVVVNTNSGSVLYDGQAIAASPPILKDGRIYLPLRLLRDTGMAELTWHPQQKSADVLIAEQNVHVRYQAKQPTVSFLGSDELGEEVEIYRVKVPAPFLINSTFYIPVQSFERILGKNIAFTNNTLTVSWGKPLIARNSLTEKTDQDGRVINVLYEAGLDTPLIMHNIDIHGAASLEFVAKDELMLEGKKFLRLQVRLPLDPGDNPFYLWVRKGNINLEEPFIIKREMPEGSLVPVHYLDPGLMDVDMNVREVFEITEPASGYVKLSEPGSINIKGTLKQESFDDNVLSLTVGKIRQGKYQKYGTIELPAVNGRFAGTVELAEPGSYLLEVISPKYIPYIGGPLATKWAELKVEVEIPDLDKGAEENILSSPLKLKKEMK